MEFFIWKAFVVLFASLDFPSGNSQGDCCLYLLDYVAGFFCSTSFLRYRPSDWTLQWVVAASGLGVLAPSSLLKVWNPALLLGDATGANPCPYAEGVTTLSLYSCVPFSPLICKRCLSPARRSGMHPQTGDATYGTSASPDLGLGSWSLHSWSKANAVNLFLELELEWEPSGLGSLWAEARSLNSLFDHKSRALCILHSIIFLRLR